MKDLKLSVRLAVLSLYKKKESCFVLILLALLTVLFLDLGLATKARADALFYEKTEELHGAHFIIPSSSLNYRTEYEEFLKAANPEEFVKEEVAYMPTSTNDRNTLELGAFLFNREEEHQIEPIHILEEDPTVPADCAIYVPIQLKRENVLLGEPYTLTYKGKEYSFIVAGYIECCVYSNLNSGFYRYFVNGDTYTRLMQEVGSATILSARFQGSEEEIIAKTEELSDRFLSETNYEADQNSLLLSVLDYRAMQDRTITFLFIAVALLLVVSGLIAAVTVCILANNIREDIDKSTEEIGTLQAMGYVLSQITTSYVLEYLFLTLIGGILGVIFSYLLNSILGVFLAGMSGFTWKTFVHPIEDVSAIVVIALLVSLVSAKLVKRLKNITLVTALSGRRDTIAKHKTSFPLQKGRLPLNLHFAIKNLFLHSKSSVVFSIIVAICTFAVGITLIVFLNFSMNTDAMMRVIGFELSDAKIEIAQGCDAEAFEQTLNSNTDIRKTNLVGSGQYLRYNNESIMTFVPEDFSKMEYITPYQGEFPQLAEEVMISSMLSDSAGKTIGDSIILTANDTPKEFLISGIFSSTNGNVAYLTEDGIRQLYPDYRPNMVDVYLQDGVTTDQLAEYLQENFKISVDNNSESIAEQRIARLLADYGVTSVSYSIWQDGKEIYSGDSSEFCITDITYMKNFASGQIASHCKNLSSIVVGIFIMMLLIAASVLRMTSKSEIVRCKNEFGILKALGYTTGDIVKQISLRFLISTLCGSVLGAVLAMVGAPALFRTIFGTMGVTQVQVSAHPMLILIYCAVMCVLLYGVTMLTGSNIRKISAYELLAE